MTHHQAPPHRPPLGGFLRRLLPRSVQQLFAVAAVLLGLFSIAYAVAPPAGTSIGNQASATYTDSSSTTRTVVSATVVTIVQQVSSFTLTTDGQTKMASPGAQVTYPHTLTNTGNGTDSFSLAGANAAGNTYNLTNIAIYADANGDGIPDNNTPITSTGTMAAGAVFKFVLAGTVPGTATSAQTGALTVTATGTGSATPEAGAIVNTDTTTVSGNAVINVTKAISATSGPTGPATPYTYTLTYTNNGNVTSGPVTLKDVIPAGMNYVQASARWSVTGASPLDPTPATKTTSGTAPLTVQYDYAVTTAGAVTATISQVQPGESRTVSFNVTITAGLAPQNIANTATYTYDPGTGTPVGPFTTNTPIFTVAAGAAVSITGQTIASAPQGATISFTNPVVNNGNGTDSFDITVANSTFPAGTVFSLFKSDGVTPLVDTNGNTTPDTGPLAAGATYNIVIQATLPTSAVGTNLTAVVTATSKTNSSVTSSANDILSAVTAQTVDVTEDLALPAATATNGKGAGPEGSAVVTNTATGGSGTSFSLFVNNTSTTGDTYNLQASTDPTFATQVLPSGWSVTFKSGAATVANTGSISAGANANIIALVTLPAGQGPGTQNIYFRALSPTTGAADVIHDAVTVAAVRSLVVTPNNTAQIVPGGAAFYTHNLVNNGTVLEGDNAVSTVTLTTGNNQPGWSSIIYWDKHNSGVIAADDPVIATVHDALAGGLPIGGSLPLLIKVIAPAGASAGANDRSLLTITTTNGTYVTTVAPVTTATDDSTVVNGQLAIVKSQASAFVAPPAADGPYSASPITSGALPGKMIRYQIVVTNNGTAPATNIVINDSTPAYTTYTSSGPAAIAGQGSAMSVATVPADGVAGPLVFNVGTLTPGQSATATFGVKINP